MTRKRVGQGLLEVFSEPCEHCRGRGVIVSTEPVDEKRRSSSGSGGGSGSGNGRRERSGGSRDAKDTVPAEVPVEESAEPAAGDGEVGEGARSGGRRNRGRRNRGQSGEERVAEDAAVLTVERDDVEDAPENAEAPAVSNAVEVVPPLEDTTPVAVEPVDDTVVVEPIESEPEPAEPAEPVDAAAPARPRRRRAASRPAGPPV